MSALTAAEFLKLRTTRTAVGLSAALVALSALGVAATTLTAEDSGTDLTSAIGVREVLSSAALALTCVLALGIVTSAGEARHRTLTDVLLTTPRRDRVLLAKLASILVVGLLAGVVVAFVVAAVGLPLLAAQDAAVGLDASEVWRVLVGLVLVSGLYGALGVAWGMLVPNLVAAMISALVWVLGVEPLLLNGLPSVGRWLPVGAAAAVTHSPFEGLLAVGSAIAVLFGWVVVLAVLAAWLTRRRDVT